MGIFSMGLGWKCSGIGIAECNVLILRDAESGVERLEMRKDEWFKV